MDNVKSLSDFKCDHYATHRIVSLYHGITREQNILLPELVQEQ